MPRIKNRTADFVTYSQTATRDQLIDMRAILTNALTTRFPILTTKTQARAKRVAQKLNGIAQTPRGNPPTFVSSEEPQSYTEHGA